MTVDTLSYLALGDSYTIGESVEKAEKWPVQLAEGLRAEGLAVSDPLIIARTGWTTDELAAGIEEAVVEGSYDLVSLLIGVNNQYRGRELEEYRVQFVDLLHQAIAFAGGDPGRVLVLSIPDWGVMPFAEGRDRARIATEIDAFNLAARDESEAAGAVYVDITEISREATTDATLVAGDGLHPSAAMYARWVEEALEVVRALPRFSGSG